MKMADVVYKVKCKDCPSSYILETTWPLEVRPKDQCAESDKSPRPELSLTSKEKALKQMTKSAIAEQVATENYILDWDNAWKIEQVPD